MGVHTLQEGCCHSLITTELCSEHLLYAEHHDDPQRKEAILNLIVHVVHEPYELAPSSFHCALVLGIATKGRVRGKIHTPKIAIMNW